MNIAFLYNVRHRYPDPKKPKTLREADFDDPETTELQIKYLKKLGYKVYPIEANEEAYFKLYKLKGKIDLVFNVSEGLHGADREAQIPAMLEMLQIPYTGSPPLAQAIILNKSKTKEILIANKIPTLQYQLMDNKNDKLKKIFKFPLMVKPVSEGSSAGITNKSVVHNETELYKQVDFIFSTFNEEALIEPYLEGREFSIAMLGNPPQVLPILESDHSMLPKKYLPFDSLEVKWFYELATSGKHLKCPAKISPRLEKKINKICLELWDALGIRDWCRIDIRCDKNENPYVLEVNSPPGCTPPEHDPASYFPLIARSMGIDYENLLKKIIETALKRYKK
ncbi:ATP-grasp domain-containing protein [Candidatus Microgenomates bacterium]|nr:MAG: ATP-grasp domain-containing protein [Candidatus Microgenomates bacterium]